MDPVQYTSATPAIGPSSSAVTTQRGVYRDYDIQFRSLTRIVLAHLIAGSSSTTHHDDDEIEYESNSNDLVLPPPRTATKKKSGSKSRNWRSTPRL